MCLTITQQSCGKYRYNFVMLHQANEFQIFLTCIRQLSSRLWKILYFLSNWTFIRNGYTTDNFVLIICFQIIPLNVTNDPSLVPCRFHHFRLVSSSFCFIYFFFSFLLFSLFPFILNLPHLDRSQNTYFWCIDTTFD